MCTALSLMAGDHYFGRNLDLDRSYGEEVVIMPRRFPLVFRTAGEMREHYAMIGMATVIGGMPLFYEAANEYGLSLAGLNFPENAHYAAPSPNDGKDGIAPFELIPWLLGQCKTVAEAELLLKRLAIVNIRFSETLPLSPLHWMLSDRERSLVIEPMKDGLHIYDNPIGVLTNNPPFLYHLDHLDSFRHLRCDNAEVVRDGQADYSAYCQGLGAVGLPGDLSSMSRFVRMAFGKKHSVTPSDEASAVGQFFHLLTSVEMVRGLCKTDEGTWDITGYSACINTDRGRYYYTTYENRQISCVDMHKCELNSDDVYRFPLLQKETIAYQN